jgi:hypothetical protein
MPKTRPETNPQGRCGLLWGIAKLPARREKCLLKTEIFGLTTSSARIMQAAMSNPEFAESLAPASLRLGLFQDLFQGFLVQAMNLFKKCPAS